MQQVKRYAEIMRDMDDAAESPKAAVRSMTRLLSDCYGVLRPSDALRASVVEVVTAAKTLHFVVQEIVLPSFRLLSDEPEVERQASVFDRYDEEEGYNDEPGAKISPWAACLESIETITQATIKIMHQSYSDTMKEEMVPLIQHLKWEIDHQEKEKKGG